MPAFRLALLPAALLCAAALRPALAGSRVDRAGAGPRLVVGGRPVPTTVAASVYYIPDPRGSGAGGVPDYRDALWVARMREVVDRVAGHGGGLMLVKLWWSDFDDAPARPGRIEDALDFRNLDSVMDYAAGKGVSIMPDLTFAPGLPGWWLKENRFPPFDGPGPCDFCETDSYGGRYNNPSMGSEKTRRDFGAFLAAMIRRYRAHPALAGWSFGVGATGEDNYGPNYIYFMSVNGSRPKQRKPLTFTDYSPFFQRRFREWLRDKHRTDAALRRAWGDDTVSLEDVGVPAPREMLRQGRSAPLFPDPADLWWGFGPDILTPKGLDFYEFRIHARAAERKYYASLFKRNDPDHALVLNSSADDVLADPDVDGITVNPNLDFGAPLTPQRRGFLFQMLTRIVQKAVRSGKLVIVSGENVSDGERFRREGRWESDAQLDYIETFGKSVKCAGGIFSYTEDLMDPSSRRRWLPTWFSPEARRAIRRIAGYEPPEECLCPLARASFLRDRCSGEDAEPGCAQLETAYRAFCRVPEEPGPGRAAPRSGGVLEEVLDQAISPPDVTAVRPDVVLADGRFYVGYTQLSPRRSFALLTLGPDLKPLDRREVLPAGPGQDVTDLRLSRAEGSRLWCSFETTLSLARPQPRPDDRNFTHWARFTAASGLPVLEQRSGEAVASRPGGPPPRPDGTELTDDPAPFFHKGKYYIGTRRWGSTDAIFYAFDGSLRPLGVSRVDLSGALGEGQELGVYSLLDIEGEPWLIGGVDNRKPAPFRGARSYLAAVPLSDDLTAVRSKAVVLSRTRDYQHYVAGARYLAGRLFVAHNVFPPRFGRRQSARLKVFDAARGFRLLADAGIDDGEYPGDDHVTLEAVGDKIHVFYPTPEGSLRVKVFRVGADIDE